MYRIRTVSESTPNALQFLCDERLHLILLVDIMRTTLERLLWILSIHSLLWFNRAAIAKATEKTAEDNVNHGQQSSLRPFPPGDPGVRLTTQEDTVILDSPIEIRRADDGRKILVQDIHARANTVWDHLLDFDRYASMIPGIVKSQVRKEQTQSRRRGGTVKTTQVKIQSKFLYTFQNIYIVRYEYHPSQHSMTWSAFRTFSDDPDEKPDAAVACCVGYWHVRTHPHNPDYTRVFHAVELSSSSSSWMHYYYYYYANPFTHGIEWLKIQSEVEERATTTDHRHVEKEEELQCSTKQHFGSMIMQKIVGGNQTALACGTTELREGVRPIGVARYTLFFSVLSLSLYNIYLFIWQ